MKEFAILAFVFCLIIVIVALFLGHKIEIHNNYYFGDGWRVFKNNG